MWQPVTLPGPLQEMAALLAGSMAVNVKNEPEDLTGTVNNNRRPSASDHDIHSG